MKRFLSRFHAWLHRHLNEFIKWTFLLGLYLFYRMLAIVFGETGPQFLIMPLIWLGVFILIIDHWLDMLISLQTQGNGAQKMRLAVFLSGLSLCLSLILLFAYLIFGRPEMICMGVPLLLTGSMIPLLSTGRLQYRSFPALFWTGSSLVLLWLGILVRDIIVGQTLVTALHFLTYMLFFMFYLIRSLLKK